MQETQLLSIKYTAPTYWKTSNWSSCSVLCGNGTITRNVTCTNGNCDNNDKPLAVMPCVKESCDHYQWVTDDWTQVSAVSCDYHMTCCYSAVCPVVVVTRRDK